MKTLLIGLMLVGVLSVIAGESTLVLNDPGMPVTLTCPLQISGDMTWSRNGSNLVNSSRYYINNENKTLTLSPMISENDLGNYFCKILSYQESVVLKSRPIMSKPPRKSFNLIEGETLTLECKGYAFPPPSGASWAKDGSSDFLQEYDPRVDTEFTASKTGKLTITGIRTDDDGGYTCSLFNELGRGNVTFTVRINSKLAPLWPIIGIIVEVLLVAVIIVVLEKKRSRVDNKEC